MAAVPQLTLGIIKPSVAATPGPVQGATPLSRSVARYDPDFRSTEILKTIKSSGLQVRDAQAPNCDTR